MRPLVVLRRNSASPAVNDLIGQIQFQGEHAASSNNIYGQITGIITDPTNGSEDGLIRFESLAGGNLYTAYQIHWKLFYQDLAKVHIFEGSTDDSFETQLTVTDPTADRTITLPDATGTVLINSGNQTHTGDLTFPDNEKAIFGTGGDLEIFHDSANSLYYGGTGDLVI